MTRLLDSNITILYDVCQLLREARLCYILRDITSIYMASFIEEIGQNRKAEEAKNTPEKEEGDTLEEIQNDPERSRLFGMYLDAERDRADKNKKGDYNLGHKLMGSGELTDADLEALQEKRKGFLSVLKSVENIEGKLDLATVQRLAESSPALKKLTELRGPQAMHDAIMRNFSEVAINDKDHFKRMSETLVRSLEAKKALEKDSNAMVALAKKYGLSKEEYMAAITEENDAPGALAAAVKDKVPVWKSLFVQGAALEEKARKLDKRAVIDQHLATIQKLDRDLGGTLKTILLESKSVRKDFLGGLRGEKGEAKNPALSFKEGIALKNEKLSDDEVKKIKEGFAKYYKEHSKDPGLDLAKARSNFATEYTKDKLGGKGGGFWSFIGHLFLPAKVESALRSK
jgi:hypothetical protein